MQLFPKINHWNKFTLNNRMSSLNSSYYVRSFEDRCHYFLCDPMEKNWSSKWFGSMFLHLLFSMKGKVCLAIKVVWSWNSEKIDGKNFEVDIFHAIFEYDGLKSLTKNVNWSTKTYLCNNDKKCFPILLMKECKLSFPCS